MGTGRGGRGSAGEQWSERRRDEKHRGELREREGENTRKGER